MKKQLLLFLFAIVASVGTMFADGTKIGDVYYNLNATDQTAEVTYELRWNENNYQGLTTANIPASVTYSGTTYSVTSIGEYAFSRCSSLTSVTIPNSVTSIGGRAFYGCSSLTSVTIGNSVTSIGHYAFYGCSSLTSVTIPNSVTSIGNYAFSGCSSLTSVTIGNGVTSIGNYAFSGCSSLTSVTIPNSVTSIGDYALEGCSGLTSVTIPNSVTSIGGYAFYSVNNIIYSGEATGSPWGAKSVNGYVDGYLVYSDETKTNLIGCSSAATGEIVIPNSVTSIGQYAFYDCSSLTSVTIPNSVTSIGENAFEGCSSLTSVTIPNSVTSIGKYAFSGCSSLTSVTIGNSVTSIGYRTFSGCSSLTSVTIPNSVTSIGQYAFYNCSSLTSVESPALLFNDAFEIFLLSINEMPSQIKYLTINAGTLTEEGFDRIRASYRNLESVDLANTGNTELSDEAFKGCYNLQILRLPAELKEIKYMAVAECVKLQAIDIPATVESIGDRAFEDCRSMATVTFAGNAIQSIGCWAFYNCHALQNIVIPEGVTEIGSGAFYGCTYLNDVIVPASVSAIGDNAFALCSKMAKMQVNAVIPPTIAAKTFDEVSRQMPVYVPDLSVATYKSDPLWGQMNIIGISNIVDALDHVESSSAPVKVISDGQLFILLPDGTRYSATGVKVE